jgi:TonB family protein
MADKVGSYFQRPYVISLGLHGFVLGILVHILLSFSKAPSVKMNVVEIQGIFPPISSSPAINSDNKSVRKEIIPIPAKDNVGLKTGHSSHQELNSWSRSIVVPYPPVSVRYREEGTVLLSITIENGVVIESSILKTSGFERLDQAALQASFQWKLNPGISIKKTQAVTFKISS